MSSGQQTSGLLFLYLVTVVVWASAQTESTAPNVKTILARMAQARDENRAHFRPYIVTRDYKLFGKERLKAKSQVIADITFVPPDLKKYVIEQTNGTGLGEKIVRRMLQSETDVAKDYRSTDISPDNYDFRLVREEEVSGQNCYVLELLPRRKDMKLLSGSIGSMPTPISFTASTGDLRRLPLGGCGKCAFSFTTAMSAECGCKRLRKLQPKSGYSANTRWFRAT